VVAGLEAGSNEVQLKMRSRLEPQESQLKLSSEKKALSIMTRI
jgi:hypothetical protein